MPTGKRQCSKCQEFSGTQSKQCVNCGEPFLAKGKVAKSLPVPRKAGKPVKLDFQASLAIDEDSHPCLVLMKGGGYTQLTADETEKVALTLGLVFFQDSGK